MRRNNNRYIQQPRDNRQISNLIKAIVAAWVSLGSQLWGRDYHAVGLLGGVLEVVLVEERGRKQDKAEGKVELCNLKEASVDGMGS